MGKAKNDIGDIKKLFPSVDIKRLYSSYNHMLGRCYNRLNKKYPRYGGRGITVSDEWRESFKQFVSDMGDCPKGHSLNRINNDGNYCADNCEWSSWANQQRNRSSNRLVIIEGVSKTLIEWCSIYGISQSTACQRVRYGWSYEEAITIPVFSKRK